MQILIVESSAAVKAVLRGRVSDGLRQADIRELSLQETVDTELLNQPWGTICGVLIGPSNQDVEKIVNDVRRLFPQGPLGVVLNDEVYQREAVPLTKKLDVRIYSMSELTGLASFIIECGKQLSLITSRKNQNIFGICQFKGGVGATSVAVALASCWARHNIKTALVDLDDVNPHITSWARVGISRRTATAEYLALGQVPESSISDLLSPVESFNGNLSVIGQPDAYNEGFHFKANVIDNAPSSSEFMHSLLSGLKASFDAIVVDLSRSWGLATFATLPRCQRILLVTDDDRNSLRRSLDILRRMKKESDDPDEFDLSRWAILINGFTGTQLTEKDIRAIVDESEVMTASVPIVTIPYSTQGRSWGEPGQSLYDASDPDTRRSIERIANNLLPFRSKSEVDIPIRPSSSIFGRVRAAISIPQRRG